ncbi:MAG: hypothetical protein HQM14_09630 [SAR324 cluster bacterium]|nr:hypothetical protein [SAR324 cluster bacterium]
MIKPVAIKSLRLGADDFVRKPFNGEQLAEKVSFSMACHIEMNQVFKKLESNLQTKSGGSISSSLLPKESLVEINFHKTIKDFLRKSLHSQEVKNLLENAMGETKQLGWDCTMRLRHNPVIMFLKFCMEMSSRTNIYENLSANDSLGKKQRRLFKKNPGQN